MEQTEKNFSVFTFQIHYSSVTQTFSLVWLELQRVLLNIPQINNNKDALFSSIESDEMEKSGSPGLYVRNIPQFWHISFSHFTNRSVTKPTPAGVRCPPIMNATTYNALRSGRIIYAAIDCAVYGLILIVIMQMIILYYSAVCISC